MENPEAVAIYGKLSFVFLLLLPELVRVLCASSSVPFMMVRFSTVQQKMVDSDQTQGEYETAKENGSVFDPRFCCLNSKVSQRLKRFEMVITCVFYRSLEKAERRRKKNRKKKEKKKEKKKAQQQNEGSPGEKPVSVVITISVNVVAYVSNNVCSKGVMCMQLNPTISKRK